jgi:acetyl esterase/lipase
MVAIGSTSPASGRGLRVRLLDAVLRRVVKAQLACQPLTPQALAPARRRLDLLGALPAPAGVVHQTTSLGGVPAEWTRTGCVRCGDRAIDDDGNDEDAATATPRPAASTPSPARPPGRHAARAAASMRPPRIVFHLHGGAYIVGSPRSYRELTWRLAAAGGADVVTIDYRLAPEHCYPAASDDALAAYAALLASGHAPSVIVVSGDSAGGNLALATLLRARDAGLPLPAAAVLLSPWTDMTGASRSLVDNATRDAMLPASRLRDIVACVAPGMDAAAPLLSPVYADLRGLPPLLVHASDSEILRDDARRLAAHVTASGGSVRYREWPDMPHVFQAFARLLPTAREALDEIGGFIRAATAAP